MKRCCFVIGFLCLILGLLYNELPDKSYAITVELSDPRLIDSQMALILLGVVFIAIGIRFHVKNPPQAMSKSTLLPAPTEEAPSTNTPERAEWWKEFICTQTQFPAPDRLRAQFAVAEFSNFCVCGCNSFEVTIPAQAKVAPITSNGGKGLVFEADFHLTEEGRTLEVLLFANEDGNLYYVEIDCCGNSYPIPEVISTTGVPYFVNASPSLLQ